MKKIAIIYSTYDGILNSMCGVGAISNTFISCFTELSNYYKKENIRLDLHLITPALTSYALGYSENLLDFSKKVAHLNNGDVHLVLNGTDGSEQFGNVSNWQTLSCCTANKVIEIAQNYDETISLAVDIPFMYVPYYIEQQQRAFRKIFIKSVMVLHSDVLSHHSENPDIGRLAWEASAIKYSCHKPDIYFAKTSDFLMHHLVNEYNICSAKIVRLQTGLNIRSNRYAEVSESDIIKKLREYNIPVDRDLIFSVGRAVDYKGFDLLIKACSRIKSPLHLVFVASPYLNFPSNVEDLKQLIDKVGLKNCTAIYNLDFDLPKFICQWKKTRIVAQLSKHEPFGLVPEEVRLWARKQGPVPLMSNVEGYIEQIRDGVDGFRVNINNINEIARKIDYIYYLKEKKIQSVKQQGFTRVKRDYDYRLAMFDFFEDMGIKGNKTLLRKSLL